jgi:hypothetical protein
MLRLMTNTERVRASTVDVVRLTSPPVARKEETRIAEIINVGAVTIPENVDARAILRRTTAR